MRTSGTVDSVLHPLAECPVQAYLTNVLQVADVVEWCIEQLQGEATIRQTSFSISEEFIRRLYNMRKKGNVKDVELVLDHKATNKTLRLWPFIVQTIDKVFLADNHSKIILIEADGPFRIAIVTSQNLTRGNRQESAVITTCENVYTDMLREFQNIMTRHSVPMHELFCEKICLSEYI